MHSYAWAEHLGALRDEDGRTHRWYDQTGGVPPVVDLARPEHGSLPSPAELLAHHGVASVPFDEHRVAAVCGILDDGSFHRRGNSVLVWHYPDGDWRSTTRGRWPQRSSARAVLDELLGAVVRTVGSVVRDATGVEGTAWSGARLQRIVPYNLQRRRPGAGQHIPHFDYEDRELLRAHVRRCEPALLDREPSVVTLWVATHGLLDAPLVFYPNGSIRDPYPGALPAMIDLGDVAITDSRVSTAGRRAFVFDPDRAMHGAVGRVDADGHGPATRQSLEIRSFVVWAEAGVDAQRPSRKAGFSVAMRA